MTDSNGPKDTSGSSSNQARSPVATPLPVPATSPPEARRSVADPLPVPAAPVPTIFMVRRSDVEVKRYLETYDQTEVFLGLYHVLHSSRSTLERIKKNCSDWLFMHGAGESAVKECLAKLKAELKPVVDCYDFSNIATREKFDDKVETSLFQDACFVIAVLSQQYYSRSSNGSTTHKESWGVLDAETAKFLSREQVKLDVMKLENQIPMRVLQTVLEHAKVPETTATMWFANWIQSQFHDSSLAAPATPLYPSAQYHLVHYLHSANAAALAQQTAAGSVAGAPPPPPAEQKKLPSAEELHRSGIRFSKPASNFTSLLEIRLTEGGKLKIPAINVSLQWMVLLQSLVDFEQGMIKKNNSVVPIFSAYVKLLADLLRTPGDVQLLRRGGVGVTHKFNSDSDLVDGLRNLSAQVTQFPSTPRFNKLLADVAKHPRPGPSTSSWISRRISYMPSKVDWIRRTWKPLAALLFIAAVGTYTTARARARKTVQKPQKSTLTVIPKVTS